MVSPCPTHETFKAFAEQTLLSQLCSMCNSEANGAPPEGSQLSLYAVQSTTVIFSTPFGPPDMNIYIEPSWPKCKCPKNIQQFLEIYILGHFL